MNDQFPHNQQPVAPTQTQAHWYENSVIIILLLLCCFPIGLPLLWVKKAWSTRTKLILTGIWLFLMGTGAILDRTLPKQTPSINTSKNNGSIAGTEPSQPVSVASPITATKPSFAELQQRSDSLLKLNKEEYSQDDVKEFDAVMQPLREIPKDSKDYIQAQTLNKKLIDKSAKVGAEMLVLGPKPKNSEWDGRVEPVVNFLRKNLNDYGSCEFVEWSPVTKVEVKKEPYWVVRLKLRAKNSFGALILKETYYLIRQNEVVSAQGL